MMFALLSFAAPTTSIVKRATSIATTSTTFGADWTPADGAKYVVQLSATKDYVCGVNNNNEGELWCGKDVNSWEQITNGPYDPNLSQYGFLQVTVSTVGTGETVKVCVLTSDSHIYCAFDMAQPTWNPILTEYTYKQIDLDENSLCVIGTDFAVYCSNSGTYEDSSFSKKFSNAFAVSLSNGAACLLRDVNNPLSPIMSTTGPICTDDIISATPGTGWAGDFKQDGSTTSIHNIDLNNGYLCTTDGGTNTLQFRCKSRSQKGWTTIVGSPDGSSEAKWINSAVFMTDDGKGNVSGVLYGVDTENHVSWTYVNVDTVGIVTKSE
eukprot:NODE_664_length_5412_cov_0.289855.p3 type:complete len:323 gc:universal NODE_664_length_5412_cov_0.289855:1431-463(-)